MLNCKNNTEALQTGVSTHTEATQSTFLKHLKAVSRRHTQGTKISLVHFCDKKSSLCLVQFTLSDIGIQQRVWCSIKHAHAPNALTSVLYRLCVTSYMKPQTHMCGFGFLITLNILLRNTPANLQIIMLVPFRVQSISHSIC